MYAKVKLDDEALKFIEVIKNHTETFDEIKDLVFTKERLNKNYEVTEKFNLIFQFQKIKNSAINKILNEQELSFPEGFVIERLIAKYMDEKLIPVEEHFEQIKANCNNREEKRKKHKKITKIYNTLISKLFCNCENFEGVKNEKTN